MPSSTFSEQDADFLSEFLSAEERPAGTLGYPQLAGFLFSVCCAPEEVETAEWLAVVFDDQDAAYQDQVEAEAVLAAMMRLYDWINDGVENEQPKLPPLCSRDEEPLANFDEESGLSAWSQGFLCGHDWLIEVWTDIALSEENDEELGGCLMVLSFFADRELAEAYREELKADQKSVEAMAAENLAMWDDAMAAYADIGRAELESTED